MSNFELNGSQALIKALRKKASLNDVKKIIKVNGSEMQRDIQRRAAVDTGTLKRSVTLSIEDDGLTARVYSTVEYAPYLEYGTRFMAAQPFFRPVFLTQKVRFMKDLSRIIK